MSIFGRWMTRHACILLGYVYPIFASKRALDSKDRQELIQWITFWAVNACFWALELVVDNIVGWIPMYYETKVIFLGWMVLPSYRGATKIYEKYIAHVFLEHEKNIDTAIDQFKRQASERFQQVCKETATLAVQKSSEALVQGQQYVTNQIVQHAVTKLANDIPLLRPLSPKSSGTTPTASAAETTVSIINSPLAVKAGHFLSSLLSLSPPTSPTNATAQVVHHHQEITEPKAQAKCHEEDKKDSKTSTGSSKPTAKATAVMIEEGEELGEHQDGDYVCVRAESKQTLPIKASASIVPPVAPVPTPTIMTIIRSAAGVSCDQKQDKSKELVNHFKKLLVRGFKLKYHPSKDRVKQRMLRLSTLSSRYLIFESTSSSNTKSVRLLLLNIRRVSSVLTKDHQMSQVDQNVCFCIDNGKTLLIFEADCEKTRDLLVSGMRLLLLEHKRQDTNCFNKLNDLYTKQLKQQAFDRMVDTLQLNRC